MSRAAPGSLPSAASTIALDCSTPSTLIVEASCVFQAEILRSDVCSLIFRP